MAAGEYFPFTYGPELPDEQSEDDSRSLVFDGAPLIEGKDIVGAPKFSLRFSSDQPDALIYVRLCDVFPDGRSALITYGYLNLTHHASHEHPEPLEVGRLYVHRSCWTKSPTASRPDTGCVVAISTASWPSVWPSPRKATVTLSAASVDLPIRPMAQGPEWTFAPPEAAPAWHRENIRKAHSTRTTERKPDGTVVLTVFNDFGCDRDLEHGLETGSLTEEVWSIHPDDPLSARAKIRWKQTSRRGTWNVGTTTTSEIWSDHTHFHMTGSATAYEDDVLVFERHFQDKIKRDCV